MRDVVVIGGTLSALVAAQYLKRAGKRVVVLGDAASSFDSAAPVLGTNGSEESGWVPPKIVNALGLEQQGYVAQCDDPWLVAPTLDGGTLELSRDIARAAAAIARLSARDAKRWPAFCARMAKLARVLEGLYCAPPPDPTAETFGGVARLAALAFRARRLGRQGIEDLLRLLPMSAADFLEEWFESDTLKGALGELAIRNLAQGPRSSGTAFNFLHHHVGNAPGVFAAQRSNAHAVLRTMLRTDIRDGAQVARIELRQGRVTGVVTVAGDEHAASVVVSSLDPLRTMTELIDVGTLDPELVRAIRHVRARGVAARVRLDVAEAPPTATLTIAPSLDALERAYDDWKYGRVSEAPSVSARLVEHGDRSVVEAHVQYVPCGIPEAQRGNVRGRVAECVVQVLSAAMRVRVTDARVLLPDDLEATRGYREGQPYQAELGMDQLLWMRPVPQLAHYAMPIRGLYFCGEAMHPGIPALTAANAAGVVIDAEM